MNPEEILLAAIEKKTPAERAAYLDGACRHDAQLRALVDGLLLSHDQAGSFLEQPVFDSTPTVDETSNGEKPGTVIGPYKLLQQIGEGGMGTVYMAEQTHPVRRMVAAKIIKPGMDSRQVIARLEAERQALALMDHPNIAKVLDAGATPSGRPYFVMELVKGMPITKYCDERRLTPKERLELFVPVCHAVQHAHQKGIIHRDLKPSNVLIALYDGKPVPKVIDFGVAKATGPKLTDRTMFTEFGQVVGTLEYMSPEQAELNQLDIDTRSDIYALGVLMYELLTGTTPLQRNRLTQSPLWEALRTIREEEPPRPSTRLSTTAELPSIAANRGLAPNKLSGLVRGELDWIVMKCLEKDRNRRYETANSLALDIQRYLHDEPVQACPPSAAYRFRKLVRRNKRALAAACVVLAGLVLAVVGLTISTVVTLRAKNQLVQSSYFQAIALADREWSANNLTRAEELLERCPPHLRGWEWHCLKRRRAKALAPLRHDNGVFACAVSPDSRQIASVDMDGSIYFWDPSTAQELRPPIRRQAMSRYVVFSPDGGRVAVDGWRVSEGYRGVEVWDVHTGRQLSAWQAPAGDSVRGLAFSAGGKVLACICVLVDGREDAIKELGIWDPLTGEQLIELKEQQLVHGFAVSHDGSLFATANIGRTVTIWDARTGKVIRTFHGDSDFQCVAFSPDGDLLAAASGNEGEQGGGSVKIWEVKSGRARPISPGHGGWSLAFSPDGKRLATGGIDQAVKIWDTTTGQEVLSLRGHTDWVFGVAFSPDGHRLVSASHDRTVRIWDGRPWQEGDLSGEEVFTLRGHTDSVNAVAFDPQGILLATASTDGTLKIWDPQTWRHLRTVHLDIQQVDSVAFSPDGKRLAAAGGPSTSVTVLDATTGKEQRRLGEHSNSVAAVAFSPDGQHLASGDGAGVVIISDVTTGAMVHRWASPSPFIYSVAFSPDRAAPGRLLAVAFADATVRIWDTTAGREIAASPLKHQGPVYSAAFSSDGQLLASSGWDRTVRIWDTATWKQVQVVLDAAAAAQGCAFSPDSQVVAWGTSDSAVKVWHRPSGEIHTLRGHLNWIRRVAFSPDGKLIASASQDGTAKVWEVPTIGAGPRNE